MESIFLTKYNKIVKTCTSVLKRKDSPFCLISVHRFLKNTVYIRPSNVNYRDTTQSCLSQEVQEQPPEVLTLFR